MKRTPKLRRQKCKNRPDRAFVEIDGKRHFLGRWDAPETQEAYARLILQLSTGQPVKRNHDSTTVLELCADFLEHMQREGSTELEYLKTAVRRLTGMYGHAAVDDFTPSCLRAVRDNAVTEGLSRSGCNRLTNTVRRIFKYGVGHELVQTKTLEALRCVESLRAGKTQAWETAPRRPVPLEDVEATIAYLPLTLAAMVRLQLLTAARPGEICQLRGEDIDRSGEIWTATLEHHKTAYRGRTRTLYMGKRGQEILRPFLVRRPDDEPLFSPREAIKERAEKAPTHRRSDQAPNPRKTSRTVGERYDAASYRRAIAYAAKQATVPIWTPNQLRHTAATLIREQYGLDVAQYLLDHASADITQVYAEVNRKKVLEVVREIG